MAPPTIRSCGAAFATMPGMARAKKPRMSAAKETRKGVAILPPRRDTRIRSCSKPAMPTVAASARATRPASGRVGMSAIITAISAMLNSSGENAVRAKRDCAEYSASITVEGPAKAR